MIERLLQQSNSRLKQKLGFHPEKSSYRLYDEDTWSEFCISRPQRQGANGVYLPRTLTAHILYLEPMFPGNFFHEYFGHGSYCEHTENGQKIVGFEQKLAEIEKEILGVDELPEDQRFTITRGYPLFGDYVRLQEEFEEFSKTIYQEYEGFAREVEAYLLSVS